ncbi:unnamed protein product, partial [Allacma fusca]
YGILLRNKLIWRTYKALVGAGFATSLSFAGQDAKPRESNNLGELIAQLIKNFTGSLGDPWEVISELSIPIEITERVYLNGTLNISDVQIAGLTTLDITDAKAALLPLGGSFKTKLPELVVSGNYAMDALLTSLFPLPLHGAGPFSLRISETALNTDIKLKLKTNLHLEVSELAYELDIYEFWIRLEGLFSDVDPGGELNEAVNIVLNSYLTILFNMFESSLHDDVNTLLVYVANTVLANMTLADLIDLIGGGGSPKVPVTPFQLYKPEI